MDGPGGAVAVLTPALIAALAFLFRDIPPRERRFVLALLVLPTAVNALSDDEEN